MRTLSDLCDADGRLRVFPRVPGLPRDAEAQGRRMLRVLLVRLRAVSTDPDERGVLCAGTARVSFLMLRSTAAQDQSSPPPPPSHDPASLTPKSLPPMSGFWDRSSSGGEDHWSAVA